jgi:hypothetical protein
LAAKLGRKFQVSQLLELLNHKKKTFIDRNNFALENFPAAGSNAAKLLLAARR